MCWSLVEHQLIQFTNQLNKKIKPKFNLLINEELLKAVKKQDSSTVSDLLKSGISTDGIDEQGYTLMQIAESNKDKIMQHVLRAYGAKN